MLKVLSEDAYQAELALDRIGATKKLVFLRQG